VFGNRVLRRIFEPKRAMIRVKNDCMQGFGGKDRKKETTRKTYTLMGG
jgi:hypothetical protein